MGLELSKRVFVINDGSQEHMEEDPLPGAPITQVKKALSSKYPSITSSNIEEPIVEGDTIIYNIKAVGGQHG